MEQLQNGFTLNTPPGSFPLSTDSILLADFARLPKAAHILDLGSGCGTLGLLLCAKDPGCAVTGVELDKAAHEAALDNIARNGLSGRLSSICADLRSIPSLFSPGEYQICISNPPYFSGGPASKHTPQARRSDNCSIEDLAKAAAWAVRYGGDFYVVHKPERLGELVTHTSNAGLEPKRLRLVRHDPGKPISLVLLQCRKGGKPGLIWEELCLSDGNGTPTEEYRRIYHI